MPPSPTYGVCRYHPFPRKRECGSSCPPRETLKLEYGADQNFMNSNFFKTRDHPRKSASYRYCRKHGLHGPKRSKREQLQEMRGCKRRAERAPPSRRPVAVHGAPLDLLDLAAARPLAEGEQHFLVMHQQLLVYDQPGLVARADGVVLLRVPCDLGPNTTHRFAAPGQPRRTQLPRRAALSRTAMPLSPQSTYKRGCVAAV